jgi:N-acetylglucosamine-6-phosphate deacetylase
VTLDICVRNFAKFTGCSLGQAIKCATYNPAAYVVVFLYRLLLYRLMPTCCSCVNIENRKGTLRSGADADLVILDAAGYVKATWVSGKKVWPAAN